MTRLEYMISKKEGVGGLEVNCVVIKYCRNSKIQSWFFLKLHQNRFISEVAESGIAAEEWLTKSLFSNFELKLSKNF